MREKKIVCYLKILWLTASYLIGRHPYVSVFFTIWYGGCIGIMLASSAALGVMLIVGVTAAYVVIKNMFLFLEDLGSPNKRMKRRLGRKDRQEQYLRYLEQNLK